MSELSKSHTAKESDGKVEETVCVVRKKLRTRSEDEKLRNRRTCYRCGRFGHLANDDECPALKAKCNSCGTIGHYERCCKASNNMNKSRKTLEVTNENLSSEDLDPWY